MTLPTVGGGDGTWGTTLNAHIDVGHDTDGTHTKSQMLTDMGWSPTTITGASDSTGTVTFPNGLILKWGKTTRTGTDTTVTFGTAFPTACFQAIAVGGTNINVSENTYAYDIAVATFKIQSANAGVTTFRWFAVGY